MRRHRLTLLECPIKLDHGGFEEIAEIEHVDGAVVLIGREQARWAQVSPSYAASCRKVRTSRAVAAWRRGGVALQPIVLPAQRPVLLGCALFHALGF